MAKIDVSEAERNFSVFNASLSAYVMNSFATYEDQIGQLTEALKQKTEEVSKLQKELENKESSDNRAN